MDHEFEGVDDEPAGVGAELDAGEGGVDFLEEVLDGLAEGLEVGARSGGGDDEMVGDGGLAGDVEDAEFNCLLVIKGLTAALQEAQVGGGVGAGHERRGERGGD